MQRQLVALQRAAQLAVLRRLGCDEIQGFILSPALPPDGVGQLVRARSLALSLS